jgi:methylthioribose-1-phosphate isomerase
VTPFTSTALKFEDGRLWVLDQTELPHREAWLPSPTPASMIDIIRRLKVRGAPLIGVAAALQVALLAEEGASPETLNAALRDLREARPTAVNLMNALDRLAQALRAEGPQALIAAAEDLRREDERLCLAMAENGSALIGPGERLLTHCNTGGLATVGVGTALGCVILAARQGKTPHVYVDETRPLLQGGRLTTWELAKNAVSYTLICDNMAGYLMQKGGVDRVLVGADRIARNGDFANKVGTYALAVLCRFHNVPFYVVAPQTTVDANCADGAGIPVEERDGGEVRGVRGAFGEVEWAVSGCATWNPAFDVTPGSLVTAWIMDRGVFSLNDVQNGALLP